MHSLWLEKDPERSFYNNLLDTVEYIILLYLFTKFNIKMNVILNFMYYMRKYRSKQRQVGKRREMKVTCFLTYATCGIDET